MPTRPLRSALQLPLPLAACLVVLVWVAVCLTRLLGPSDLMDDDQERPAAYVADVLVNGNWIVQRDDRGGITSKPPVFTWAVALTAKAFGFYDEWILYLPGALAVLAMALIVLLVSDRDFGRQTAVLAPLVYLLSGPALKQVKLARTDVVFSLFVTLSVLALANAVRRRGPWWLFWALAAVATLTKGPLGLLLPLGGLVALAWPSKDPNATLPHQRLDRRTDFWVGAALFVVITGGWFAAAVWAGGQPVIDKMIGRELVGHALSADNGEAGVGNGLLKPTGYFLTRFFPWSILAFLGIVGVVTKPSAQPDARATERFLAAFILVGLAIFSLAAHQRSDHLLPLLPAAAILAGRELSFWWKPTGRTFPRDVLAFTACAALILLGYQHIIMRNEHYTVRSRWARQFADHVAEQVGRDFPLIPVDMPYAMQFRLGTMRQCVSPEVAAEALKGDAAAFVVVRDIGNFKKFAPSGINMVAQWPEAGDPFLAIYSNRATLAPTPHMVAFADGLRVEVRDGILLGGSDTSLMIDGLGDAPQVELHNIIDRPRTVTVTFDSDGERRVTLLPGEQLTLRRDTISHHQPW